MQGEEQKKLDVITNTVLKNALRFSGKMVAGPPAPHMVPSHTVRTFHVVQC